MMEKKHRNDDHASEEKEKNSMHEKDSKKEKATDQEPAAAGASGEARFDELKKEICEKCADVAKLNQDLDSLRDVMQRRQADYENYKKRMLKAQEDNRKFALKNFALDIIDIHDDLLRAIEASAGIRENELPDGAQRSFAEGVEMISKRIIETLQKYGIAEIDAENREFNPNYHEAVEIELREDVKNDTVVKVYQKGFCLEDLVLRTARVKVAKPRKQEPKDEGNESEKNELENTIN